MNRKEFVVSVKFFKNQNHTFFGHILESQTNVTVSHQQPYDQAGALYYILAVIFTYSLSILLMIGSFARKTKHDRHMSSYMKDLERVGKMELKQENFRTKLNMHNKKVMTSCFHVTLLDELHMDSI